MTSARRTKPARTSAEMVVWGCAVYSLRAATRFAGRDFGACTRIRTRDQLIKSQLLYQLSYAGAPAILSSLSFGLRRSVTSRDHPPQSSTRASMIARL